MYLKDQIALIDQQIGLQLPKECGITDRWNVKYHGLCREMTIQNNLRDEKGNKALLGLIGEDEDGKFYKVTIDDQYDVQIMHVPQSNTPSIFLTWGSYYETNLNYEMKLVYIGKKKTVFERIKKALENTPDTLFRRANYDTESVMRNDVKIQVGTDKNYPPEYWAFTIYYGVNEIEPIIEDEE